ncbi:hypothetical protein D9619_002414 [Psilocybe cf. subviscida]|uniref:Uncharacterized protein n=1 Tax=Psilocybe cf. subviscida TaxID=2480587 RepID=A0A8H5AZI7_9AGAR|nr:hypothetical protein D9619_002414 [Psilocybe cf. subviscida]
MMAAHSVGNILEIVAKTAPGPYLDTSFAIFKVLYASIRQIRGVRAQMTALVTSAAELLYLLNDKLQGMQHLDESIQIALHDFNSLLSDIQETAGQCSKRSYLNILFTPADIQSLINQHNRKISQITSNFQTHLQMVIRNDVRKLEEARKEDHRELLSAVHEIMGDKRQFAQAANEAMKHDFPLTEKDVREYFSAFDMSSDERELEHDIVKALRYWWQYPGLNSSNGWSPQQYGRLHTSNQVFSEEPGAMTEAESQIPLNPPYPPCRRAYPVDGGYLPPYLPRRRAYPVHPTLPLLCKTYGNYSTLVV